jgi:hypothetical protein
MQGDSNWMRLKGLPITRCEVCEFRLDVLPDDSLEEYPGHQDEETTCPFRSCILRGLHANPGKLWRDILWSKKLRRGDWECMGGQKVFEMPTRNMLDSLPRPSFQTSLEICEDPMAWTRFSSSWVDFVEYGFHFTELSALVEPNSYGLGRGILRDGLVYGACTHLGNKGVNFFGSWQEGYLHPGMCCLKIRCVDATRLKGKRGMRTRHCVRGEPGEVCKKVVVESIFFHRDDVPDIVQLSSR